MTDAEQVEYLNNLIIDIRRQLNNSIKIAHGRKEKITTMRKTIWELHEQIRALNGETQTLTHEEES